jgi:hypothetical protein
MRRTLRIEFEDAIYYQGTRGNARQAIFRDERDCACFLELLSESNRTFDEAVLCFVDPCSRRFYLTGGRDFLQT